VSLPENRKGAGADVSIDGHAADHAGIDRLIDGLVPALVAKLGTLNVGELEVRQDGWRVRLQRPPGAVSPYGRRVTDRAGQRSHPGHEGLGAPAPVRTTGHIAAASHPGGSNGSGPALSAVGPGRGTETGERDEHGAAAERGSEDTATRHGPIATSPAVGVFQPGSKAVGGTRVRAGDRLGVVDMLGIPQDVLAPADGIVIGVIVDGGTAVEYGQELVHIEAAGAVEAR
jgi:acetyl-CoA carboxylase biotin carboxyl carrier protein